MAKKAKNRGRNRSGNPAVRSAGPAIAGTVGGVEVVDHLAEVQRAATAVKAARRSYLEAIEAAHDAGCSMGEIGQVLGISRQALQQQRATLRRTFGAPAGSSPKASAGRGARP